MHYDQLQEHGFGVVAVDVSNASALPALLHRIQPKYPVVRLTETVARVFDVTSGPVPVMMFVNEDNALTIRHVGQLPTAVLIHNLARVQMK